MVENAAAVFTFHLFFAVRLLAKLTES